MKSEGGQRIRRQRERQGYSLRRLAREAGIDHGRLSRIERGLERPTVEILAEIGRVLELTDLEALQAFARVTK